MIRLKDPRDKIYSAFHVCEVDKCTNEAEEIYASSESRIIDLCLQHYNQITNEGFMS